MSCVLPPTQKQVAATDEDAAQAGRLDEASQLAVVQSASEACFAFPF